MHVLPSNLRIGPATHTQSTNWSGYADTSAGGTYTKVSSNWTEPSVTCNSTESIAVFWVGIDGYDSGTVEQDGTLAYCYEGSLTQYTWWEMYPNNDVQIVGSSVQAGDKIRSVVTRSGSSYTLTVKDITHPANSFTEKTSCSSCENNSAEWIAERPSGSSGLYPLPDFGKIVFQKCTAKGSSGSGSISAFPNDQITMVNSSGDVLAQPSKLRRGGKVFTDTWKQMQ